MFIPTKAFVLAAGRGERMRPLTNHCPKPLLKVGEKAMLDHALDALVAAGVKDVVVNAHYLAEQIETHVKMRHTPRITVSYESLILDTGGGVAKVLSFFGDDPFFVLNGDVVWTEGQIPILNRLAASWSSEKIDILISLTPLSQVRNWQGKGDYYWREEDGSIFFHQGPEGQQPNMIFNGIRLVHPRAFSEETREVFSFVDLFHRAEKKGRLQGLIHEGEWHHVGTPEALDATNEIFQRAKRLDLKAIC